MREREQELVDLGRKLEESLQNLEEAERARDAKEREEYALKVAKVLLTCSQGDRVVKEQMASSHGASRGLLETLLEAVQACGDHLGVLARTSMAKATSSWQLQVRLGKT